MCGITGFVRFRDVRENDEAALGRMMDSIRHRGPDDEGRHIGCGAFLGHRRLSIIDVSGGRQPLQSEDGTVSVICNGEIYNHHGLRKQIESAGHHPATKSDCEVIVHLWEDFEKQMPAMLDGMFAFALWDEKRRTLILARDRMGKKPLYYFRTADSVIFGSELRALLAHPEVPRRVSASALYRYMTLDYVPTPDCIIEGVRKVRPGSFVAFTCDSCDEHTFWDIPIPETLKAISPDHAAEDVWNRLVEATGRRLESEVPLGVFLSGGLDSGAVLAAMAQHQDPATISTFTIGFRDPSFDESAAAGQVAAHFGTRHHEKILGGDEALRLVADVAGIADEPLADYSILPTTLLARFAREHVTVALSGDGGDELFHGYDTFKADRWARIAESIAPRAFLTTVLPAMARLIPVSDGNMSLDYKVDRMLRGLKYDRFSRHMSWVGGTDPADLAGTGGILNGDVLAAVGDVAENPYPDVRRILSGRTDRDAMKLLSLLYARLYMLDGVLVKVDRASMNTALEVRSPFLDTALVELAFSLPASLNLENGGTKTLMRRILADKIPASITSLPKKGFGVPMAAWLRHELKPLVERHLDRNIISRQGFFNPDAVEKVITDHMSKRRNRRKELFGLLVFQLWQERWL